MASIYQLKPAFQSLLRPIMKMLVAVGMTANQVTLSAAVISLCMAAWLCYDVSNPIAWFCLPAWLFARMALNAIDGMMARECDMKSPLGAVLNELGDVIADTALFIPFLLLAGVNQIYVLAFIILAIFTEMAGLIAIQIGASRRYDGPMGKSDRAFCVGLMALFIGFDYIRMDVINYAFMGMSILCLLCIVNRVRSALKEQKDV